MISEERRVSIKRFINDSLFHQSADALVDVSRAKDPAAGMKKMISSYGIGSLVPDSIILEGVDKERFSRHYAEAINVAHDKGRNVVIFSEKALDSEIPSRKKKVKYIDVWWDERSRNNSELMVLLAYMLTRSSLWRRAKICIKSLANDEAAKAQRLEYFEEFLARGRFQIETEVYVNSSSDPLAMVRSFSNPDALVMLGMRAPDAEETIASYCENEYSALLEATKDFPMTAFALSAKSASFDKIFC